MRQLSALAAPPSPNTTPTAHRPPRATLPLHSAPCTLTAAVPGTNRQQSVALAAPIAPRFPRRNDTKKPQKLKARPFPVGPFREAKPKSVRLLRNMHEQVNQLVRVPPLIVIPAHELDESRAQLNARFGVEDRGARIREEVGGNHVVLGVAENALALVPPPVRPRWSRCLMNRQFTSWPPAGGRPPPKPCSVAFGALRVAGRRWLRRVSSRAFALSRLRILRQETVTAPSVPALRVPIA